MSTTENFIKVAFIKRWSVLVGITLASMIFLVFTLQYGYEIQSNINKVHMLIQGVDVLSPEFTVLDKQLQRHELHQTILIPMKMMAVVGFCLSLIIVTASISLYTYTSVNFSGVIDGSEGEFDPKSKDLMMSVVGKIFQGCSVLITGLGIIMMFYIMSS